MIEDAPAGPAVTDEQERPERVHVALAKVMSAVGVVRKTQRNTNQGYAFRGVDDVLNAVGPALREHGVLIRPAVCEVRHELRKGKDRPLNHYTVTVDYTFVGPAGDELTVTSVGEAMDVGDKGLSKAMSVALRTALIQTLALPTGDRDPDADTYELADSPADGQDDEVPLSSQLRSQISTAGKQRGWSQADIERDFRKRTGRDIAGCEDVQVLAAYLKGISSGPDGSCTGRASGGAQNGTGPRRRAARRNQGRTG